MCQTKEQGGRRCPSHQPAYLGLKAAINDMCGLDDSQIKHAYDVLRLQGTSHPDPSPEDYREFVKQARATLKSNAVSLAARRRALRQFDKPMGEGQLPDGATFYALSHLVDASQAQQRRIRSTIQRFSRSRGIDYAEAEKKYRQILESSVSPRRQRRQGVLDVRTRNALEQLYRDQPVFKEEFRRVQLQSVKSNIISAAGYDPEDGRLEVRIGDDIHAFRNVSPQEWQEFQKHPMRVFRSVREDDSKNYLNAREAEEDAQRIWCNKCKRFRLASGHRCPATGDLESVYQGFRSRLQNSNASPLRMPEWYKVWEKRPRVDMRNNPSPAEVMNTVDSYAIAEFSLTFTAKDGSKVSGNFEAGKAAPRDVTLRMQGRPRCDCEAYQKNSICKHVGGGKFERSARSYYAKLDEGSAIRNPRMEFPYDTYAQGGRITFSCPPSGMSPQMVNDIAFVCREGNRAMMYLNDKSIRGDGSALGAFIFSKAGNDIEVSIQANCTVCHRSDCHHLTGLADRYSKRIQEKLLTPEYRLRELDRMDRDEDERLRSQDSSTNRFSSSRQTTRYSDDIGTYINDLREAEAMVKSGESPLKMVAGTVTNGNISSTPGQGRGFGVEIEYVVDDPRARFLIQDEIARTLAAQGLSRETEAFDYGTSSAYTDYQEWAVEDDSSVSGEVISPILYDTAESWQQIATVCDIIKKHGGRVDESCGQHVHIGASRPSVDTNINIMQFMQTHQDSLRRTGTNPERGTHRNNMYSIPMVDDTDAQGLIYDLRNRVDDPMARDRMVNFQNGNTIEFRDADGSLNPAHIQAQVMIAAAVVAGAERNQFADPATVRTREVGSNRKRTQLITGGRMKNLSDDEVMVSDIAYRSTVDALFDDEHGRKTMVALAAMTPWQKGLD